MVNLLVSLDRNYLPQLKILLFSIRLNNPGEKFTIYLLHSGLPAESLEEIDRWSGKNLCTFSPVTVPDDLFWDAPVSKRYPREMYYRLLAGQLLPKTVVRALYLDPDILIINPLKPLWELNMDGHLFAAAAHTGKTELANSVNRLRFGVNHDYYNSGVLLIDISQARHKIKPEQVFSYVEKHTGELLLPDQDLLNALYGSEVLALDDSIWNYDARNYNNYLFRSGGEQDLPWVMRHTAILHFCGREKPWKRGYPYRFGMLYQHYAQLAARDWGEDRLL